MSLIRELNLSMNKIAARFFSRTLLAILTIGNGLAVLLTRDPTLVLTANDLSNNQASEFSRSVFCNSWPECFRYGSSLLGHIPFLISRYLSTFYAASIGRFTQSDIANQQYLGLAISLIYRVSAFVVVAFCLWVIFKSWFVVAVLINSFFLHLTGAIPIRTFNAFTYLFGLQIGTSSIGEIPPIEEVLQDTVEVHSRMYFVFYDFSALAMLAVFLVLFEKEFYKRFSLTQIFAIGFFATSIFEHLAIVAAVACIVLSLRGKDKQIRIAVIALTAGALASVVFAFSAGYLRSKNTGSNLLDTWNRYGQENFHHLDQIIAGFIISLLPVILLGLICGLLLRVNLVNKIQISNSFKSNIQALMIGLSLSYSFGFFTSGLSSEVGRQTLGLQILLLIYTFVIVIGKRQKQLSL
jgi:hypothetical protein